MLHGIDTDFLVALEVKNHPFHLRAISILDGLLENGHTFAIVPQTLAEFVHVATDSKRMPTALSIEEAIDRAEAWWTAEEVVRVFPGDQSVTDLFTWIRRYQLGKKRILDTFLASSLQAAGVKRIITNNRRDFQILAGFEIIDFK